MGWASEMQIEELNARYETDADFRREYDAQMQLDAALEAEFFAQEAENEKQVDWFDDLKIDHTGYVEMVPPAVTLPVDDDIPF